jgi:hypothetical protein
MVSSQILQSKLFVMKPHLLAAFTACLFASSLYSQYWSAVGQGMSPGGVYTLIKQNDKVYAAGQFDSAGQLPAFNVAKWDGSSWTNLGTGVPGAIYTQEFYNGELYAGGIFDSVSGSAGNIAKWNGSTWSGVGGGLNNSVHSLCVYNGELYAGGYFTIAGLDSAYHIAKWNGNTWSTVGNGTNGPVATMIVYNNELYVGGDFTEAGDQSALNIARWNGSTWSAIGNGMDNVVTCFATDQNNLYAGGWFTMAGTVPAMQVARWDGTNWHALGSGVYGGYLGWGVQALAMHNNKLYAGGEFYEAGGVTAYYVAAWDGSNWSSLGAGTDHFAFSFLSTDSCLYVGGIFGTVNQNIIANRIAKWIDNCAIPPAQPSAISGSAIICENTTQIYSVDPVNGASSYTWTLPAGWIGTSISNSITVLAGQAGGNITVTANNSCGSSAARTLGVTVNSSPIINGPITGNIRPCLGTTQTYSIPAVPNAQQYSWVLPAGWTGFSFTNTINVTVGQDSGLISVRVTTPCGTSPFQSLFLSVDKLPGSPGLISGNTTPCFNTTQRYAITPLPGIINYNWTFPQDWAGSSNADTITMLVGQSNGVMTVSATNACGTGNALIIPLTVSQIPATPYISYGYPQVCAGTQVTYSVEGVIGATNYNWVLPPGWSGPTTGQAISVTTAMPGGDLKVQAGNSCGWSEYLTGSVIVDTIPDNPGIITGNIYVSKFEAHDYSTNLVQGATIYRWQTLGGLVSNSNLNTAKITWLKKGRHKLYVSANNYCGASLNSEIEVTVIDPEEEDPYEILVGPNPNSGQLNIYGKRLEGKYIRVEIFNIYGQQVCSPDFSKGANVFSRIIDMSKLPAGNYVVKLVINNESFTKIISKTK